ncbi:MAG TPA: hypothetical protein VFB45_22415 [Pseudolabrys sp.]|nr:hypothetical protein [Pseudolabrys sp.]
MPVYLFHISNGGPEDHSIELENDDAAVAELVHTAASMLSELKAAKVGKTVHSLEITRPNTTRLASVSFQIERHT